MQHPDGGPGTDGGSQEDLSDLLAPADVQFRPAPPPARPRRTAAPVPAVPAPAPAPEPADLTRPPAPPPPAPRAPGPPVGTPRPAASPRPVEIPRPAAAPPPVETARPAAAPPPVATTGRPGPTPQVPTPPLERRGDAVVTFGRWFQPVTGGLLPRPDPAEPDMAVVRAPAGSTVHAVTAGRVHRAPVTLAAGGLEIAGDDGTTLVLVGPPETAWVRDDEDVAAGEVVGVLPTGAPGADDVELRVLVIGPDGVPRDAVDVLVGLPDPGELDLGPGLGTDPFALDLEIAGPTDPAGTR